jgi:hypothetical protein
MTLLEEIQLRLNNLPLEKQGEVLDFVTFLQERVYISSSTVSQTERRERIANAFSRLAKLKTFADISDPVDWQRQIRKDRTLPGRNE